jgi:hypothetical protein
MMTGFNPENPLMTILIGSGDKAQLTKEVEAELQRIEPNRAMYVVDKPLNNLHTLHTSMSRWLVVLFVSNESHDDRTRTYHEQAGLMSLLRDQQIPCIIVYRDRHYPPGYLRKDEELNVLKSFVPAPISSMTHVRSDFMPQRPVSLDAGNQALHIANEILTCKRNLDQLDAARNRIAPAPGWSNPALTE